MIVGAPYESTMGLVQKIFYFHVPSWMAMFLAAFVAGVASVAFLVTRKPARRCAGGRGGGARGRVRLDWSDHRAAVGRKAWGVWWRGIAR